MRAARRRRAVRLETLLGTVLALMLVVPPDTGSEDCRQAKADYQSSLAEVRDALRAFARCVAASHGRDPCTADMQTLDDADDDFEDAVSGYKAACR